MTGNNSGGLEKRRSILQGSGGAGEKPALNEKMPEGTLHNAPPPRRFSAEDILGALSAKDNGISDKAKETKEPEGIPSGNKEFQEAVCLFQNEQWANALQKFKLVTVDKSNAKEQEDLAYYLGLCYSKLEQYANAILYIEQVTITGKESLRTNQCRMALAYAYIKTGRAKMAEFELKRLKNAGFESASMYNTLAYAAYAQKQYRQAIDYYEKSLVIDENNATALNSMGYILADTGVDAEKGVQLCRKAAGINPQSGAYMDSVGWAYFKCGEMTEARKWLRRALEAAPKEEEIREHFRIVTGGAG